MGTCLYTTQHVEPYERFIADCSLCLLMGFWCHYKPLRLFTLPLWCHQKTLTDLGPSNTSLPNYPHYPKGVGAHKGVLSHNHQCQTNFCMCYLTVVVLSPLRTQSKLFVIMQQVMQYIYNRALKGQQQKMRQNTRSSKTCCFDLRETS